MLHHTKKVIIIGATSGIGKRLAEIYAEKGFFVGITGRRSENLQSLQNQFPSQIHTACFDVTENENIKHVKELVEKLGGLDILIYSSGIGIPNKNLDWETEKKTIDTNVNGFLEIITWGYNFFKNQNHGSLVTISSVASYRGNSWAPAYNASKALQSNYFEGLSIKASRMRKKFSLTCIEPGFVETDMAKGSKLFWIMPLEKACMQIIKAIDQKKRKSNLSFKWWIVAQIIRMMPYSLYKKMM